MKKNIVMVIADQLRADVLASYGGTEVRTPNLDALAKEGVVFDNMYCQSPVCGPSRASMISGRHVFQHRVTNNMRLLPRYEFSYAEALSQNGYTAAIVGKSHHYTNGFQAVPVPIRDSFEYGPDNHPPFGISNFYASGTLEVVPSAYDQRVMNTACAFLEDMSNMADPFMMNIGFLGPHNPYALPEPYASMYNPKEVLLPDDISEMDIPPMLQKRYDKYTWMKETDIRKARAFYYGLITMLDDCIGQLIQKLKDLGVYDNTLLIFTSDHGEMLGDRGLCEKFVPYEASVKVPCLIRGADFAGGRRVDALTEHIDLTATMLDYAGIEIPDRVSGKSLMGLLHGDCPHKEVVYSQITEWRMLRDKRYKLVIYTDGYGELYDMEKDPHEITNLYSVGSVYKIRGDMEKKMLMHYINTVDHSNEMFPECLQKRGAFNNGIGN